MSVITLRLPDRLMQDLENHARLAQLKRSEYIRQAIERLNADMVLVERTERLKKASLLVRKESMKINKEFDEIEHDIED